MPSLIQIDFPQWPSPKFESKILKFNLLHKCVWNGHSKIINGDFMWPQIKSLNSMLDLKKSTWLVCKRNTRIRLWIQQNKYWFPNQKWKKTRYWLENLLMNYAILFKCTTHLLFQWYRQHCCVLFLHGLRSLVAQQIRNFAAANILNTFLLACALIFNSSEARCLALRLHEAARSRGRSHSE